MCQTVIGNMVLAISSFVLILGYVEKYPFVAQVLMQTAWSELFAISLKVTSTITSKFIIIITVVKA